MIKKFVSPNLKHKNGKIYYLNKSELQDPKWNYVQDNYYIEINEINKKYENYDIRLVCNDYSDDILVECDIHEDINDDDTKKILSRINTHICDLDNHGETYHFVVY